MRSKMTSAGLHCLISLLVIFCWSPVIDALCSLDKFTTAKCDDLEDVKDIEIYHLNRLRAPLSSKVLATGNFENLTSLQHLDLSGGKIETIKSGSFSELTSLQTLILNDNHLSHLEAGAFDGLKHLKKLQLRNNDIKQLPSALITFKGLKELDLANNPLDCNCASLKMRDALLSNGVKISKETLCSEPSAAKHASLTKPDTGLTCAFESQDLEMQADQPEEAKVEGSGEDGGTLKDAEEQPGEEATATDSPVDNNEEETTAASATSDVKSEAAEEVPVATEATSTEATSTEGSSTSTTESTDKVSLDASEDADKETTPSPGISVLKASEPEGPEDTEESNKSGQIIDLIRTDAVNKMDSSSETSTSERSNSPAVLEEGSGGGAEEDGSGSGLIPEVPTIDFGHIAGSEEENSKAPKKTTTEGSTSWGWGFPEVIGNLLPFGSSPTTTQAPVPTEKSLEDALKEDQLMTVAKHPPIDESAPPKIESRSGDSSSTNKEVRDATEGEMATDSVDSASTLQSKQSMASYIVLAVLLTILATLIITAAYKGDFCRKKTKRRDIERGTELKDMQKSLLDQNVSQPKIRASNGNTLENVPLMHGSVPPEEPKGNQRSYDITPSVITNGSSRVNGAKPPRKSPSQEIAPPLNGLNPPMDAIDGPTTMDDDSNEILHNGDYDGRSSPNAHRVKITMQDIPDSLPRTPILITRLKDGENLVKAP